MNWLKELSEREIQEALEGDMHLVYEICGLDIVCLLWKNFAGMNIYVSTKPLRALQKLYIKKHYNKNNVKEIACKLGVSEKFVYNVINDNNQNRS